MRVRVPLALVLVLLALPGPASAYVIGGQRWPGHRITYFNADRALAKPVALAVHAWNTSGVRLKFVKAPRSRAQVILHSGDASRIPIAYPSSVYDNGYCAGFADVGWWPGRHQAHVTLDRDCAGLLVSAEVITHELGHILGLQHARRGCALMTPSPYWSCRQQARMWQYRCRFIEADDLRGAIRLYGGRARKQPRFCNVYAPPAPPTNLKLDLTAAGQPKLSWRNPGLPKRALPEFKKPVIQATAGATLGECTSSALLDLSGPTVNIVPGANQQLPVDRADRPGVWCYTVRLVDEFGRQSHASTVVTIPNVLPSVSFTAMTGYGDGNCAEMSDSSVDPDGQIVAWQWDFGAPGDPGNSSADPGYAGHCYAQPGTYTITLTVTDDAGGRAAGTQSVTIP